jgi:hypothetical protein
MQYNFYLDQAASHANVKKSQVLSAITFVGKGGYVPELDRASIHLPHTNPFLQGNFAPVVTETTAFDLPVEGKFHMNCKAGFSGSGQTL